MNSKRNSYRGFGIYLLLILTIVGIWYWMDGNTTTNTYTRASFESALASNQITQMNILPNREVPTGNDADHVVGWHDTDIDGNGCGRF